jgi:hypothetical protein
MNEAEIEEQYKREGWNRYEKGSTPPERARGLFEIIESHFYMNSKAPSLATYASHWLWANQGRYDRRVVDLLVARYPLPSRPRIQRGYSDWDSYGKPNYEIID